MIVEIKIESKTFQKHLDEMKYYLRYVPEQKCSLALNNGDVDGKVARLSLVIWHLSAKFWGNGFDNDALCRHYFDVEAAVKKSLSSYKSICSSEVVRPDVYIQRCSNELGEYWSIKMIPQNTRSNSSAYYDIFLV